MSSLAQPSSDISNSSDPGCDGLFRNLDVYFPAFKSRTVDFKEYQNKLQGIKDKETLELILLSELLSISLIGDGKTRSLSQALVAMAINAVLMLTDIFLFLLLWL